MIVLMLSTNISGMVFDREIKTYESIKKINKKTLDSISAINYTIIKIREGFLPPKKTAASPAE